MIISWIPTLLLLLSSLLTVQCSPSTDIIFTESGVGHSNTYHFMVDQTPWKLDWTAEGEGSFSIAGTSLDPDCERNCGGSITSAHLRRQQSGSTWVYNISGPMYLQIGGSNSGNIWTVRVSQ